ncbi:norbelladine synthase-like [Aristolochia californica]|uniref:norbelladine synthase-like n=1 Tax=Aristolochia californica TaxID=171875 RepID=UPI0035D6AC7A
MHGHLVNEVEIRETAKRVWECYGTLELAYVVRHFLSEFVEKIDVVEGDGKAGSVLDITFVEGTPGVRHYKEKFIVVDDETRVKSADAVEGGFQELGFSLYRVTFQILEKDATSSIIKSTIDYEIDDEKASNASFVSTAVLEVLAKAVEQHLIQKKNDA